MKTVKLADLRSMMTSILLARGLNHQKAQLVVDDFIGAELEGRPSYGVGRFLLIGANLAERKGDPRVVKEGPSYALVDGNKELGVLAATYCINLLVQKAQSTGIAIVGMTNYSRYGRLRPYGRLIAQSGLVGMVMNNAGPPAVTPYNGKDPILGTNPICFAFPSTQEPLVFDFGTAKKPWGEIRQAILDRKPLPEATFLDKDGAFTVDPDSAQAVVPFGDAKGYALCLAIEILAGALVKAKMGSDVDSQFDLGFLAIAISPKVFGSDGINSQIENLLSSIRSSRPKDGFEIHIPGEISSSNKASNSKKDHVNISDDTWEKLSKMFADKSSEGLPINEKLD